MELLNTFLLSVSILGFMTLGGISYGTAYQENGWKRPALACLGAIFMGLAVLGFFQLIGHIINSL